MAGKLTSIVLPVHDQADHLRPMIASHIAALERLGRAFELIIVTNACTDCSPELAAELGEQDSRVLSVDIEAGGWGRAVRAGLAHAAGETLCYTNSARTTPEMLTLLIMYEAAYPSVVVKANRRIRDSLFRRLGSLLYNLECRALFDLATWDINGTPKLFPRSFDKLLQLKRDDDLIDLEFLCICRREGYPIIEVPLLETTRHGGRATTNLRSAFRMYVGAYRLNRHGS